MAGDLDLAGSQGGAWYGPEGEQSSYRYLLWRSWPAEGRRSCAFVMLNPSTATHAVNDPTIERCQRRARSMGFRSLFVVNLFALRSTDPDGLYAHPEPIGGPANDAAILTAARIADLVVLAWGDKHGSHLGRNREVRTGLAKAGVQCQALALTSRGEPRHPLYLRYDLSPQPFDLLTP